MQNTAPEGGNGELAVNPPSVFIIATAIPYQGSYTVSKSVNILGLPYDGIANPVWKAPGENIRFIREGKEEARINIANIELRQ